MKTELKNGAAIFGRSIDYARGSEQGRARQGKDAPRFLTFCFDPSPLAHSTLIVRVKKAARWFGLSCATAGALFFLLLIAIGVLLFNAFSVPVGNRGRPAASQARKS